MSENAENQNFREPAEEILAQIQEQANTRVESPPQPGEPANPPIPRAPPPGHTHAPPQNNSLNAARDRLFHAMLVRVALKYSGKVNLRWRQIIEGTLLFVAFVLLASLVFIHYNFQRSPGTCLHEMRAEDVKKGIVRIEVVRNLDVLYRKERYVRDFVKAFSGRVCLFNPADVFRFGPSAIPYSAKERKAYLAELERRRSGKTNDETIRYSFYSNLLAYMVKPMFWEDEESELFSTTKTFDSTDELEFHDPIEVEAHNSFFEKIKDSDIPEPHEYEYMFRVEYAMLYGVLRLPPDFRDDHGIPTTQIRIDSKSKCFGDQMSRLMMKLFVGYEDTIIAALRARAHNLSLVHPETLSMGYLHNLQTHEHFHFVSNSMGRASFLTAGLLMIIFTFAISMLLRFSHHQIFVFIIDLLHMFELQQPLNPPVAPLITVVLALVGMEAIMAEVFNDTSIAFYVILIVWVADQYDAICCHSTTSKKFWLRFFYIYQFFFYSYQYRFSGQYGGLALSTSALFILLKILQKTEKN
ncbi:hypothetical protein CAEBREN_13260 [Caenorhabditis brenneri]|uniref:Membralin n=1 Tax=Caenorhabditis brenneri TaxID=135651 RepID=G0MFX4_CAEBE|nr:hypothetical protein CAEBREN_13260 [Caenorhabditis brenneri]